MKGLVQYCLIGAASVVAGTAIALMPATPFNAGKDAIPDGGSISGPARIIDGDTIWVAGVKIRMNGIDAPEQDQSCFADDGASYPCGIAASNALEELIRSQDVHCEGDTADRYGRLIATCYINTRDINAEMVRAGWAVAYRRYSEKYASVEKSAKDTGQGLWQGSFRMPWVWRAESRTVAQETHDCAIKGNISENGKIYHTPGSKWYSRTRINEQDGERWFCSEIEALAAGWRSPRFD